MRRATGLRARSLLVRVSVGKQTQSVSHKMPGNAARKYAHVSNGLGSTLESVPISCDGLNRRYHLNLEEHFSSLFDGSFQCQRSFRSCATLMLCAVSDPNNSLRMAIGLRARSLGRVSVGKIVSCHKMSGNAVRKYTHVSNSPCSTLESVPTPAMQA